MQVTFLSAVQSSNARLWARKRMLVVLVHIRRTVNHLAAAALAECAHNAARFVAPTDMR